MIYDSLEEAQNRLGQTIVTYEGRPVYVALVEPHPDETMRLRITEWPFSGAPVRKKINSPAFNRFQTPPLGFANYFRDGLTHTSYCERIPARQRHQGLCANVFSGSSLVGHDLNWARFYTSDAFREMVMGEYPAWDDAVARLVPNSSIAVDREFAVMMTPEGFVHFYYKRDVIGICFRGLVYLRQDRQYMMEAIIENPNLPNRIEVM